MSLGWEKPGSATVNARWQRRCVMLMLYSSIFGLRKFEICRQDLIDILILVSKGCLLFCDSHVNIIQKIQETFKEIWVKQGIQYFCLKDRNLRRKFHVASFDLCLPCFCLCHLKSIAHPSALCALPFAFLFELCSVAKSK